MRAALVTTVALLAMVACLALALLFLAGVLWDVSHDVRGAWGAGGWWLLLLMWPLYWAVFAIWWISDHLRWRPW